MLPLDDPRWSELKGGYRVAYDARPLIRKFAHADDHGECWKEVWDNLHHQGDVDSASYAIIPYLVDLGRRTKRDAYLYCFCAIVCLEETNGRNPPVPEFLRPGVANAFNVLFELALSDLQAPASPVTLRHILSFVAAHRGAPHLARALIDIGCFEHFGQRVLEAERHGRN